MVTDKVKSYLNSIVPTGTSLQTDSMLITNGLVDSMSVVDLIVFLESEFKVKFDDTELTPENFDTIGSISNLIEKKMREN